MSGNPSLTYEVDLTSAVIYNILFPDMRVELDEETIRFLKGIMGSDYYEICRYTLLQKYKEKYGGSE